MYTPKATRNHGRLSRLHDPRQLDGQGVAQTTIHQRISKVTNDSGVCPSVCLSRNNVQPTCVAPPPPNDTYRFSDFLRMIFVVGIRCMKCNKVLFKLYIKTCLSRLYEQKLWAIIKIQSHVRKLIAMRRYRKLKVSLFIY